MSTPSGLPLPADRRCAPVLELITDDCAASSEARASARTCRVVGRLEGLRTLQSAGRPAEQTHKSCARRASAAGGSGAAAWRHTFGVDGRSLSTPLCTSCSPSGRLRPGKGRCGSARANGRGARGCGRCGVPFCNFPAAQIGLARSGSPPWASRSLGHASRQNRLQWLNSVGYYANPLTALGKPSYCSYAKGLVADCHQNKQSDSQSS